MFGIEILEVAIGLALIFLLMSFIASFLTEWVSRMFAMRAKTLEAGIRNMLNGSSDNEDNVDFAKRVYAHPVVNGLYKQGWFDRLLHNSWVFRKLAKKGRPSNIPANTFALAVFDTLMEAGKEGQDPSRAVQPHARTAFQTMNSGLERIGNDQIKGVLRSILTSAQSEAKELDEALANARTSFENWFDNAMERVVGWYKRQAQIIIIIASVIVVSVLNVDSIAIANTLWRDDALRESVVRAAEERVAAPPDEPANIEDLDSAITDLQEELEGFDLPIGWEFNFDHEKGKPLPPDPNLQNFPNKEWRDWFLKVAGLLITALAISLGAPFWFDALNKLVNLRGGGRTPQRASEERARAAAPR